MRPTDQAKEENLPPGFRRRADGWVEMSHKGNDGENWRPLCSPLRVIARTRDDRSENWGLLIEVVDADGVRHERVAPSQSFARDSGDALGALVSLGLQIVGDRGAFDAVVRFITSARPPERRTVTDRLGWSGSGRTFILSADRSVGSEPFILQSAEPSTLARERRTCGALESWRSALGAYACGNPILILAISAAFAGPLLAPLKREGVGLHLRGASSRGKTSALRAAASVWGSPSLVRSWRATTNGLEGVASCGNDTLVVLDELGEVEPHIAAEVAYMIANGMGKSRATARGGAIAPAGWRTMLLSSGEVGLADKLGEAKRSRRAGQAVRFLEIAATERTYGAFDDLHDFDTPASLADRIKAASGDNFGVAGAAFIKAWLRDPAGAEARARALIAATEARARSTLEAGAGLDGQVVRALGHFALIGAAGELATEFGVTGWRAGEAEAAAMVAFAAWVAERGGGESFEALDVVARLRRFLEAHGAARFERLRAPGEPVARETIRDRAGFVDPENFWINEAAWAEIFAGGDEKRAAQILKARDFLICEPGRLKSKLPTSADGARGRAYRVAAAVLDEDH